MELSVELRLYHNLWGVKTTKSASVKRVLLSSATNTTQHTNSKTEQNTNIKCGKGGITRIIYRKLTDHANYLVTSLARKKQIQICFRWSVSYRKYEIVRSFIPLHSKTVKLNMTFSSYPENISTHMDATSRAPVL
jgi:hypothetical protein